MEMESQWVTLARETLVLLEKSSNILRASLIDPATAAEAETGLGTLLRDIQTVGDDLAEARDSVTAAALRKGDLSSGETRALTVMQQELTFLGRPVAPDRTGPIKRALAEAHIWGLAVAVAKRNERLNARRPAVEYAGLARLASELADRFDTARQHIGAALRTSGRGRPAGRVTSPAKILDAYLRLRTQGSRGSRAAVGRAIGVSESTVRRVAPTWPPRA